MTEAMRKDIDGLLSDRLRDPNRLLALEQSKMMDSAAEVAFDRATRLASRMIGVPVSLLSFVDEERQFFKSQNGLAGIVSEDRGTPLSHSFCQYVVITNAPLIVTDARTDKLVQTNGAVKDLNVIAYLGVPVHDANGEVLGSFCAIDHEPHDWTPSDLEALRDLAAMVEAELVLRRIAQEREVVLQEMNHRVKNLFSLVSGMIRMERRAHDEVEDFAGSLDSRLKALSDAHEMIVPVVHAGNGTATGATLHELVTKLLAPYQDSGAGEIRISGDPVMIGSRATVPMTLALHEMATNAVKYGALAQSDGRLSVTWETEDDMLVLAWRETSLDRENTPTDKGGFGSKLLSLTIEQQLGGELETNLKPETFSQYITLQRSALAD